MAKYSKQIELLNRVIDEGKIEIKCSSEKSAVAGFNKMKEFLRVFETAAIMFFKSENLTNWGYVTPSYGDEMFGPYGTIKPIGIRLIDNNILGGKKAYEAISIDKAKGLKSMARQFGEDPSEFYPHFSVKFDDGKYEIEWTQGEVTNTKKRGTEELYRQKLKDVSEKIGTINAVPQECFIGKDRKKVTENYYMVLISLCDKYINGETVPQPCSPKQAMWVSRMLGVSETDAQSLNKIQASEILDVFFNSSGVYTDKDKETTKDFYIKKLSNNENMKTLNESDIRKMVSEAVKKLIKENYFDEYRTKGSLNKKTLEKNAGKSAEEIRAEKDAASDYNPDWEESMDDILAKFQGDEEYDDTQAGGEYKADPSDPYFYTKDGQRVDADAIGQFHNDFAIVKKNGKVNFVNADGQVISDEWFDACNEFENGYGLVIKDRKRNFVGSDGRLLIDQWVDRAGDFMGGRAPIIINGERHEVDTSGRIF